MAKPGKINPAWEDCYSDTLLGGANDKKGNPLRPARLWRRDAIATHSSNQKGAGPVAFRLDGTPVQVVPQAMPPALLLWNVAKQDRIADCKFPEETKVTRLAQNSLKFAIAALSADGVLVAAVAEDARGNRSVAVWDVATGQHQWHARIQARALAISAARKDAERVLAAADEAGEVVVWAVESGKELARLPAMGNPIHCLAFTNDATHLATGDAGGTLNVWEWKESRLVNRCYGALWDVYALAFNADDTLLAASGLGSTRLWDAANGQLLLELHPGGLMNGLAFSADGQSLACSGGTAWSPGKNLVWTLEPGRGIHTLRGLRTPITKVRLSSDGRLLAALSQDWQLAVWDVETARLRRVFRELPQGVTADNAGLAISDDSRRLAFAAGKKVTLWDLESGKDLGSWDVPPGYHDHLAFGAEGQLLLFRMETKDGQNYPNYQLDWQKHPRVFRVHKLVVDKPVRIIREITEFNRHVQSTAVAPNGSYFFVDRFQYDAQGRFRRSLNRYKTEGGAKSWSLDWPGELVGGGGIAAFDPTGEFLALSWSSDRFLVEAATGKRLETFAPGTFCYGLSPGAKLLLRQGGAEHSPESPALALVRHAQGNPIVVLGLMSAHVVGFQFRGERNLAWGNQDGSVSLCDLVAIQKELAKVGLGW